ncbi:molybdopterin converting factor subunit 1 [Agaribacterium haliotis]|uniref:molybdopterin converting factor subunit 1 n=1 Tax=Agaribacterium haliotis TaxID=2013869 RepID=UPI000BB586AF|nr:molybdopterin converting factor subunit 1 [Agaribacterium haliotis]
MTISILYFAKLAELLGRDEEKLELASSLTVAELKALLGERGEQWQKALNDSGTRCAVNQEIAQADTAITAGAEVAFFPPVTGG